MENELIEKEQKALESRLYYLTDSFDNPDEYFYGAMNAHTLIEMLIQLVIFDKKDELNKWVLKTEKYFKSFIFNERDLHIENIEVKYYYPYILSFIKKELHLSLLKDFSFEMEKIITENYKLNKSDLRNYEELVIILIAAKEYAKAKSYSEKILAVKGSEIISVVYEYLSKREECEDFSDCINRCRTILNKRKNNLNYVLTEGFLYFHLYFVEMLNDYSPEHIFKSMIYGIV